MITLKIPYKFPSLNEYIKECRSNKYAGAQMKRRIERDISFYIQKLPKFESPIIIDFIWYEGNKKRDVDNVAFAKKFILDCMVKCGKIKDDNRNHVRGFTDTFKYSDKFLVYIGIEEVSVSV